ncbi:hypothetical protein ACFLZJ_00515 [Nanoarchaeota archaeon]
MPEEEIVFESKMKKDGIFTFKEYYNFCYQWIDEETDLDIIEKKYKEKLRGDSKEIQIQWEATKKMTDYFQFKMKVDFLVLDLKNIEVTKGNAKIRTNSGSVKAKIKGILVRDYEGKFERGAFRKFLRSVYEKWIIKSRIEQFEDRIIGDCDEFLTQAKAYLDIEGRK